MVGRRSARIGARRYLWVAPLCALLLAAIAWSGLFAYGYRSQALAMLSADAHALVEALGIGTASPVESLDSNALFSRGVPLLALSVMDLGGRVIAAYSRFPDLSLPAPDPVVTEQDGRLRPVAEGEYLEFVVPIKNAGRPPMLVRLLYQTPAMFPASQWYIHMVAPAILLLVLGVAYLYIRRNLARADACLARISPDSTPEVLAQVAAELEAHCKLVAQHTVAFVRAMAQRVANESAAVQDMMLNAKVHAFRRRRMEEILEALPAGVMVCNEEGEIIYCNRRLGNLLGASGREMVGVRPQELIGNDAVIEYLNACQSSAAMSRQLGEVEFSPDQAPEKRLALAAYALSHDSVTSAASPILLVLQDTSAQYTDRNIHHEFVLNMSHEMKTPLNTLAMYSEMLQTSGVHDQAVAIEAANAINDEVARLAALIDDLSELTRIEMGTIVPEKQRIKTTEFLREILDQSRKSYRKAGLEFVDHIAPDLSSLYCDKKLLRIALTNLISNAVKYSQAGGSVRISAEETDDVLVIKIRDTGVGISEGDLPRIFDKFFRSSDEAIQSRSGTGLGLALTQEIVHLHHGSLTAASIVGKGSEFSLTFSKEHGMVRKAI